jgi:hypothetical protein
VNERTALAFVSRACLASLLVAAPRAASAADAPGVLFPVSFTVEHTLVQTDTDGSVFRTDAVTDTYGGSHLVSVRPGGSRVIVDFARREVTEVSVEKSTYWTLSFSQMGDLARRLAVAEERPMIAKQRPAVTATTASPAVKVEEIDPARERQPLAAGLPVSRLGTRHFRASVEGGPAADVWVDGTVRLTPAALDALEAFERDVFGAASKDEVPMSSLAAAARRAAGGAVPVRIRRSLGADRGMSDDTALSLTPLPAFPQKLLVVEDGFRRVASPLEVMVAFAEEEALRDSSRLVK